jgi:hypothetical protein
MPNWLHILVCPGILYPKPKRPLPGHVVSFVSDNERNIIDGTGMSLQNGEFLRDANGKLIPYIGKIRDQAEFNLNLSKVKFNDIETELRQHFFNPVSSTFKKTHHLFSVPITLKTLFIHIQAKNFD